MPVPKPSSLGANYCHPIHAQCPQETALQSARWGVLPEGVLHDVFTRVDAQDLARCSATNKTWRCYAADPLLWQQLAKTLGLPDCVLGSHRQAVGSAFIAKPTMDPRFTPQLQVIKRSAVGGVVGGAIGSATGGFLPFGMVLGLVQMTAYHALLAAVGSYEIGRSLLRDRSVPAVDSIYLLASGLVLTPTYGLGAAALALSLPVASPSAGAFGAFAGMVGGSLIGSTF